MTKFLINGRVRLPAGQNLIMIVCYFALIEVWFSVRLGPIFIYLYISGTRNIASKIVLEY